MRRSAFIAGFVMLAFEAGFGQGYMTHGVSPSVTSVTPAPNWWTGTIARPSSGTRHRHHHNVTPIPYTYYPYYPYYYDDSADSSYAQQPQPAVAEEPQAPAQTIFENRPGYKTPPVVSDSTADNSAPAASDTVQTASDVPSEPEPATVLVFRDGHQVEIGNYVIVGNTLYNMSGAYRQYKIQLADLDLDATIKANEDRGVEFKVPVSKKPA